MLCSGRITWDLMVERAKREDAERFAIARIEELYPEPVDAIKAEMARLPPPQGGALGAGRAQEHGPVAALPAQRVALPVDRRRQGRADHPPALSSPSVGTAKRHTEEQKSLIAAAFDEPRRAVGTDEQHHY